VDGSPTIVLKAMGRAINKAVTIAEILKRKMPLHQLNTLSSVEMIDVFEPVEEGLDVVTSRRYVSYEDVYLISAGSGY
jgi:ribonuclease P/MRP protein subunit RPP25